MGPLQKSERRRLFEQMQPHARISLPTHPLGWLPLCSEHPAQLALPSPSALLSYLGPTLSLQLPQSAWQGHPLPCLLCFFPQTNQTPFLCQDDSWGQGSREDHAQVCESSRILHLNSWLMDSNSSSEEAPLPLLMGLSPHFQWPVL